MNENKKKIDKWIELYEFQPVVEEKIKAIANKAYSESGEDFDRFQTLFVKETIKEMNEVKDWDLDDIFKYLSKNYNTVLKNSEKDKDYIDGLTLTEAIRYVVKNDALCKSREALEELKGNIDGLYSYVKSNN